MERISLVLTFSGTNSQAGDEVYRLPQEEQAMLERINLNSQYYRLEDINIEWETIENDEIGNIGWVRSFSLVRYTKPSVQNIKFYCDFAKSLQTLLDYDELYYWIQIIEDCCTTNSPRWMRINNLAGLPTYPIDVKGLEEIIYGIRNTYHQEDKIKNIKLNNFINSLSPFISSSYRIIDFAPVFDISIYINTEIYGGNKSEYRVNLFLPKRHYGDEKYLYKTLKINEFIQSMKNSKNEQEYHWNNFLYGESMRIYQSLLDYDYDSLTPFQQKRED